MSFDYIVVGAGAAGCITAARLAEDPACQVCLIEAGGDDASPWVRIPMFSFVAWSRPQWSWGYSTEPNAAMDGRQLALTQAKILGGGTSINGMLYARGHPAEFDRWGVPGWSFAELLPFFKRSESYSGGETKWRGGSGPVMTRPSTPNLPIIDAFLDAAASAGFTRTHDLNSDVVNAFGPIDVAIGRGIRQSSALRFGVKRKSNLTLLRNTRVLRIQVEQGKAVGVVVADRHGQKLISAECEVIISAGAINSPKLLLGSGIGPADELRALGIEAICDSPGVGRNLSNHVNYTLMYEVSEPITAYRFRSPLRAIAGGLDYAFKRGGFLAETTFSAGGVIATAPGELVPDVNIALSSALMGPGPSIWKMMPQTHGFMLSVRQGTPYSRGQVRLRSSDPMAPPVIDTRYFSDPRDIEVLANGVRTARRIAAQPEIQRYVSKELRPGPLAGDASSLMQHLQENAGNVFHPGGTCRLGADADSVVDPQLRVRGVEGLRVADASVLPMLTTAGTFASSMMVGERAAFFIREECSSKSPSTSRRKSPNILDY